MEFLVKNLLKGKSGIYRISNYVNNHVYIGATLNFRQRFHVHQTTLTNRTHSDKQLQALADEVGVDQLSFEVLEVYTDHSISLRQLEQRHLDSMATSQNLVLINSGLISNYPEDGVTESAVVRTVKLSPDLVKKAEKRAKQLGYHFPEYVRFLIVNDTKDQKLD